MRGHSEQGADGDDAGAADAGDEDVVGLLQWPRRRDRQIAEQIVDGERRLDRLFRPAVVHGDKAGQKPSTQEKSLLQLDWSIWRLRPNSVSSGCTETQFEAAEQSPQPSQTRSLMNARFGGSG